MNVVFAQQEYSLNFHDFFPSTVPVEISPEIRISQDEATMQDFPTLLGFTSDSKKFVCCYTKSADYTTCEITDVVTGEKYFEMESPDGDIIDESTSLKFNKKLDQLRVQDRVVGHWPYPELKIIWDNQLNVNLGIRTVTVWLEHSITSQKKKIDEISISDLDFISIDGVFITPDYCYMAISYHTFAGEFTDMFPNKIISLSPLVADLYYRIGEYFYQQKKWDSALDAYQKVVAIDNEKIIASIKAAKSAGKLGNKELAKQYLEYGFRSILSDSAFHDFQDESWYKK